ncbi:MAG TPA: hypothetical protein DIT13_13665 [Verrucomicrobiales bacterium]|nr:hypothetical protein [Verrucomicrobiales bacterium]HRJ09074.1 class I SAM-dependent methyltransferase [Prosthecobacter sp.]HRK14155.1 class I SAM-dependent methyltransferase [Prosthecobacter sp.]
MPHDWQSWPSMAPFIEGGTLTGDDGGVEVPHSTSTPNNLTVLTHWHEIIRPRRTLETGLAYGASATLFCELHQRAGISGSEHHAVDPFQQKLWKNCALRHLESCGLSAGFTHHDGLSAQVLPQLWRQGMSFGMIYLDGSHLFEEVFLDFFYAHHLLEIGGLLAFDDSSHPHVRKVLRFLRRNFHNAYVEHSPFQVTRPRHAWLARIAARLLGRQQLTLFRKTSHFERTWMTPLRDF